jgi:hypothetical protein
MRVNRLPLVMLVLALIGLVTQAPAQEMGADLPFAQDGWYSWRVDAVARARDWCCYRWNAGGAVPQSCSLDDQGRHFRISDVPASPGEHRNGEVRIFARVEDGSLTQLRTLGAGCGVESASPWTDLGKVDSVQSLAWLTGDHACDRALQDQQLVAIAAHAGETGRQALVRMARPSNSLQQREQAIFWMGQLRVEEMRDELIELINSGDSQEIRERAIFSYAQSPADDRLEVLIAVIEDRRKSMDDRKQALFWLAQSDDSAGVDYIQQLLLVP